MRSYNIYHTMLRAAAGEGGSGVGTGDPWADAETEAASSANAKTINASDPDDAPVPEAKKADDPPPVADTKKADEQAPPAGEGEQGPPAGEGEQGPPAGDDRIAKAPVLKRIGELTRKNKELERRLAAAGQPKAEDGEPAGEAEAVKPGTPAFQEAVRQEAARQRALEDFASQCATTDQDGEKRFGTKSWEASLDNLRMLSDDGNVPQILLQSALASDDPAQALHKLGEDPELADRVLKMPPLKLVAEVTKLGLKAAEAKKDDPNKDDPKPEKKPSAVQQVRQQQSRAPEPIEPIGGAGGDAGEGLGDDVDDATWYARRQAQVRKEQETAARRR